MLSCLMVHALNPYQRSFVFDCNLSMDRDHFEKTIHDGTSAEDNDNFNKVTAVDGSIANTSCTP